MNQVIFTHQLVPVAGVFRNIVELSPMINNHEVVFFSNVIQTYETIHKTNSTARLRLSRPVFQQEVDAGLNLQFNGAIEKEAAVEITKWIDALWQIREQVKFWKQVQPASTPDFILAHLIGTDYYDCMSGGCPLFKMEIYKALASHPSINPAEPVYPAGDKWSTLSDFLKEAGPARESPLLLQLGDLEG